MEVRCPNCGSVHPKSREIGPDDSFELICHSCRTPLVGTGLSEAVDANSAEG